MRRPVFLFLVGLSVTLEAAAGAAAAEPRGPKFPILKETTYATGPLDRHGYVDYAAALNQIYGRGVTPENNANVVLWRTTGSKAGFPNPTPDYFRALGIEPPPDDGDYFTEFTRFVSETETDADLQDAARDEYVYFPYSPAKPWASGRYPHIAQWLTASEPHLAKIAEGLRRPEYYSPLLPPKSETGSRNLYGVMQPGMQEHFEIGRAFVMRALLNLGEGRPNEAWADLLSAHRLGRLAVREPTVIGSLVGMSLEMQAAEAGAAYVAEVSQTRDEWLARRRQLDDLPPCPPVAENLDRHERFLYLDLLQALDRGDASIVRSLTGGGKVDEETIDRYRRIDYEPALREGMVWFERLVRAASMTDRRERVDKLKQLTDEIRNQDPNGDLEPPRGLFTTTLTSDLTTGESIGRRLLLLSLNSFTSVETADLRAQATANLRVALALAAYHAEHGRYPEKLADLPPVPAVNVDDLFSGKPLLYRRLDDGFLLYSVGSNGRDDDGRRERDDPQRKADDLPLRVERKRPEP